MLQVIRQLFQQDGLIDQSKTSNWTVEVKANGTYCQLGFSSCSSMLHSTKHSSFIQPIGSNTFHNWPDQMA